MAISVGYELVPCSQSFDVYESAIEDYFHGSMEDAVERLLPFAEYGDVYAQFLVGQYYYRGQQFDLARAWFLPSAYEGEERLEGYLDVAVQNYWNFDGSSQQDLREDIKRTLSQDQLQYLLNRQGCEYAQYFLGCMYKNGEGVAPDIHEAIKWFELAANNGETDSQFNLGYIYHRGDGTQKNYQLAVANYSKAVMSGSEDAAVNLETLRYGDLPMTLRLVYSNAKNGDAAAQFEMGHWFAFHKSNSNKDYPVAIEWFTKSAEQKNADALFTLGYMFHAGVGCEISLSKAAEYYAEAARLDNSSAQSNLGRMYTEGTGVEQNLDRAISLFESAALGGSASASYSLGQLYFLGRGVEQSYGDAFKWFKTAADAGHGDALADLGYLYECGLGVDENLEMAFDLYQRAKDAGNPIGLYNLAECFEYGKGCVQDMSAAIDLYTLSANGGDREGMYRLAVNLLNSEGVERNEIQGLKWMMMAEQSGQNEAADYVNHNRTRHSNDAWEAAAQQVGK